MHGEKRNKKKKVRRCDIHKYGRVRGISLGTTASRGAMSLEMAGRHFLHPQWVAGGTYHECALSSRFPANEWFSSANICR